MNNVERRPGYGFAVPANYKHAHGEPFGKLRRALSNHHPEPVEGQRVAYAGLQPIQVFESDLAWR